MGFQDQEAFWVTVGAASPVIALAAVVGFTDLLKMIPRFDRQRGTPEQEARWRNLERRVGRSTVQSVWTAMLNMGGQALSLLGAVVSLANRENFMPLLIPEIVVPLGIVLLFISSWQNVGQRTLAREFQSLRRSIEQMPKKDDGPAYGGNPYGW